MLLHHSVLRTDLNEHGKYIVLCQHCLIQYLYTCIVGQESDY